MVGFHLIHVSKRGPNAFHLTSLTIMTAAVSQQSVDEESVTIIDCVNFWKYLCLCCPVDDLVKLPKFT